MTLTGKVAWITGASSGIGRAIAEALAAEGAHVILSGRRDEALREVATAIGGDPLVLPFDTTDFAALPDLVAQAAAWRGRLDILVNNAGVTRDNLAMRMKDEEWDMVIETNLKSVFRLSRAVMRGMMKARAGRIINLSSVVGHAGNAGQANYCASKAGVSGMSRSMARELGSRNITVNCVAPGFIDTAMTKALEEKQRAALVANVPLGRLGTPEDVAAAVGFLASPAAAYITGTTIHVNGGMYMG